MLGIGALSRAAGIPVETLRTWERRYGFPRPERKPSGHRLYPIECVPRLRRVAEALARGVRAGEAVGASDDALAAMLRSYGSSPAPAPLPAQASTTADLLGIVRRFDGPALARALLASWGRLGPLEFVRGCVGPLVTAVGNAWGRGDLEIRHEHFLSERLSDLLRALRLPLEERATGPLLLLTTLPGESHGLGLQMVALLLAQAGCRVLLLGTETPLDEIAELTRDTAARAVAISVSAGSAGQTSTRALRRLRRLLPARTHLIVGGDGAPGSCTGLLTFPDLGELDRWARRSVLEAGA
jgi:methylmalonyl-CoA mutase cobalamin-binding subunit